MLIPITALTCQSTSERTNSFCCVVVCLARFLHKEYTADVYEDAIMGTFVVQIEGRSISSLLYEITDGNQDDAFLINPSTGIVTVSRGGLDYEANKNYNLSIQAMNMVISL